MVSPTKAEQELYAASSSMREAGLKSIANPNSKELAQIYSAKKEEYIKISLRIKEGE